jgi:hypothetical protein
MDGLLSLAPISRRPARLALSNLNFLADNGREVNCKSLGFSALLGTYTWTRPCCITFLHLVIILDHSLLHSLHFFILLLPFPHLRLLLPSLPFSLSSILGLVSSLDSHLEKAHILFHHDLRFLASHFIRVASLSRVTSLPSLRFDNHCSRRPSRRFRPSWYAIKSSN